MQEFQHRAAITAFIWTMVTMIVAGILVFWSADAIPTPAATTTTAYSTALDVANQRLTEASQRIIALEQQQTSNMSASVDVPVSADAPVTLPTAQTDSRITLDARAATLIADEAVRNSHAIADAYLVDLQSNIAWAIPYETSIVYVRANDGEILLIEQTH